MARFRFPGFSSSQRLGHQPEFAPGTVVYVGERVDQAASISHTQYDQEILREGTIEEPQQLPEIQHEERPISWLNLDGVHDTQLLQKLANNFNIHDLTQEDIANTQQRPKLEEFDHYLFIVLKMMYLDPKTEQIQIEQVSICLGKNWVLSFQEKSEDVFSPVRQRLRILNSRVRKASADYLVFALMDVIVSHYFQILDTFGERLEKLEDQIESDPNPNNLKAIQSLRKDLLHLRRAINPLKEVINQLNRSEHPYLRKVTAKYFFDLRDQIFHITDNLDTYRDLLANLYDLQLSLTGQKMNEIMQVLTIISTIFIPCSFLAGVYGMNFAHMPELGWQNGYGGFWLIVLGLVIGMLLYFRRRKWL
ncbi:MAG: magnesium/cobalt transporter CorA [Bacteroidota bacterium]